MEVVKHQSYDLMGLTDNERLLIADGLYYVYEKAKATCTEDSPYPCYRVDEAKTLREKLMNPE